MTQADRIRASILECLDKGIKNKQEIYTIVSAKVEAPRPTIRRVAKDLKAELEKHLEILSDTRVERKTKFNCPECKAYRVLDQNATQCPICQIDIVWEDQE